MQCTSPAQYALQVTIREINGGIIGSALIIFGIGISGLLKWILMYISPLTGEQSSLCRYQAEVHLHNVDDWSYLLFSTEFLNSATDWLTVQWLLILLW